MSPTNALRGRRALPAPAPEPLPMSLHAAPGGRAVFAVSQVAEETTAWVRRIDAVSGALGPLLRFVDERVVAPFDSPGGGTTVVTSNGRRVCVASYRATGDQPEHRGCADVAPAVVALLGDRLAMIELVIAAPVPKRRTRVDVDVRWASLAGDIDATTSPTGLHFDRPFMGMAIIDAASRAGALDLLFYEVASTRRTKSRMGSARLGVATLGGDGMVDPASRRALYETDLEHGGLAGRRGPRLVAGDGATVLVSSTGRGAPCEALRVEPTLGTASSAPAGCAVDPFGLATRTNGGADAAKLDALLAAEPRRAPGQARSDGPLVVWAGDRAWFVAPDGALRSFDRATGAFRDERVPFPAIRARIAWGAIARDGEGLALVGGRLHRLDPSGVVTALPEALLARLGAGARGAVRALDPPSADRRRAARIADTWWIARGDIARVSPEPLLASALAGRAHPDATVLVGGVSRGLFLEVVSGLFRVTALRPTGAVDVLDDGTPSPVRVGFDAVERRRGGAIVVGAAMTDAGKAIAFVVDGDGRASAPRPTSLALDAGDARVRLVALPAGGALLSDGARRRVAWLDDDARELAVAAWPGDGATALCVNGEPGRTAVPTPTPGAFAQVAELGAEGMCTVGDSTWASDGTLRWFARSARALDATAEVGVVTVAPASPQAGAHRASPRAESPSRLSVETIAALLLPRVVPSCPADMVSIHGRYCVDRYEAALVDATTGEPLSPDYPATPSFFDIALADWATGHERWGTVHARAFPLPFIPAWQRGASPSPVAVARRGARPNGYVQGLVAEAACAAAGKRLCARDEIRTACRGQDDTPFPYGATYIDGACNVYRDDHPAALLHDNASIGHLDPRLDRVSGADGPLLRVSGATPACASRWGADAAYDLVGNLDEWIDDPVGAFAGGFFSRATRAGCDALITAHPKAYLDYSTGVRCCRDAM